LTSARRKRSNQINSILPQIKRKVSGSCNCIEVVYHQKSFQVCLFQVPNFSI